ncbi:MAG: MFS transporter [Candidatus Thorarchaeota archaeon]
MIDKDLWPVMLSVMLWHLGYSLYGPFVSLWIFRDLGNPSYFVLAAMVSLPAMISIFGITLLSRLADQTGRLRELLCITAFAATFQFLLLSLLVDSTLSFLIIVLPLSIFTLSFYTLAVALATSICDPEAKGRVASWLMIFASFGWSIGSMASGIAFRMLGMRTVLVIAAAFLVIAALLPLISPQNRNARTSVDKSIEFSFDGDKESSYGFLLRNRQIQLLLLIASLLYFGTGGLMTLATIYYIEGVGVREDHFGFAFALSTLIAIPILLLIGEVLDAVGRRPILRLGVFIYFSWFVLVSLTRDPVFLLILWLIPLYAILSPAITAMMADLTDLSERSRGMGLVMAIANSMPGFGAILGGLAADAFGLFVLPLISLLFLPFALLLAFVFVAESQEQRLPREVIARPTLSQLLTAWLFSLDRKK